MCNWKTIEQLLFTEKKTLRQVENAGDVFKLDKKKTQALQ